MGKSLLKLKCKFLKEMWDIDRNIRYDHETRLVNIKNYIKTTKHLSKKELIKLIEEKPSTKISPKFVDDLTSEILNLGE